MSFRASTLLISAGALLLALSTFFTLAPTAADRSMNRVVRTGPYEVPKELRTFHASIPTIVDLHVDILLWKRDPGRRQSRGHADLPRLVEANVGLVVFSAVTKVPFGLNYEENTGRTDQLGLLSAAPRWPLATWTSPFHRALHQAARLAELSPPLFPVRRRGDLDTLEARRARGEAAVGGILALEGMHALEGRLENLDRLYAAGYRMMGLTHFFDNEVAGSAHGVEKGGLTELGRRALDRMEKLGVVVDLAHASPAAVDEVLRRATKPVVVSHGGVAATCPGPRNLTDEQIRRIADTGGVVGIGLWPGAVCDTTLAGTARAIAHVAKLVGVEHVALGSDFDGAVRTPVDVTGLPLFTGELLAQGFGEEDVGKILGGNAIRVFRRVLPGSGGKGSPTHGDRVSPASGEGDCRVRADRGEGRRPCPRGG